MFSETRTRRLTAADVGGWDADKLRYGINEIYARGGYDFATPEIKDIFMRLPWYRDRVVIGRSQDEAARHLSPLENANLEFLHVSAKPVYVRPIKLHLAAIGFLFGATIAQSLDADPASEKSGKQFCVCIDPGHPSENNDGGAVTNGLREVTMNWEVALLLRDELEKDGMKVVMTKKSEGEFITNKDRAAIANESDADLFLRLHADAGKSTGFTIYYPRKKGTVHGVTGPSNDVLQSSAAAAKPFHAAFATALEHKLRDNGVKGDEDTFIGSRQGALQVQSLVKRQQFSWRWCF